MDNQSIELTFDNQLSDHLAAERLYYKSTLFWKLDRVVAVVLVGVGTYMVWAAGARWWTLIWFPLAVAEWFNALSTRPLQIKYWFKHNPKFRGTYHLTLDRTGLHFRTRSMESHLEWGFFSRVLENGRLCLLVYGTRMYSVIPKRAFKSQAELDSFRSLVHGSVGKSRGSA